MRKLRATTSARLALAFAAAVIGLCVLPATGLAANLYLQFGSVKAHGYKVSGAAGRQSPADDSTLFVDLDKTVGKQSESHSYLLTTGLKLAGKSNLSSATAKANLGKYGVVSWRFHATGGSRTIKAPDSCPGPKYTSRKGTVTGSLKLNTHSVLGSFSAHGMKASLTKFTSAKENCPSTQNSYQYQALEAGNGGSDSGDLFGNLIDGKVSFQVFRFEDQAQTKPLNINHSVAVEGGTFTTSGGNAHLVVPSGPYLSGSNDFAGTLVCPQMDGFWSGHPTGTITGKAPVMGTQTFGAGSYATLSRDGIHCGQFGGGGTGGTGGSGSNTNQLSASPACGPADVNDPSSLSVACSDNSAGGTAPYTYAWRFGDGGTSADQNPAHTYAAAGTYTVTETVTDSAGAKATETTSVTVPFDG